MRGDSPHEVGKLINYFENYINDLNKEFPLNSKGKSASDTILVQPPLRTTSQNTSHLSVSCNEAFPSILPTIPDEDFEQTIRYRTLSEDIYDRLTYQTLIRTESPSIPNLSSQEPVPPASVRSTKRRHFHTNRKRLHRRHAPTYIKELKAYLAHRQSAVTEIVKISDVKKFSNVLVWLSNQTTSPSLIETSLVQTETNSPKEFNQHSLSITTDSVLGITQENSQFDSDPIPPFTDEGNTSKSSSRQALSFLTYEKVPWKLKIRKEVFSPAETFDQPLLMEFLYLQIVRDTFRSACNRLTDAERTNMKILLSSLGVVTIDDIRRVLHASAKRSIVDQARQWSTYFSRLFPVSTPAYLTDQVQLLGISHSGLQLIAQKRIKLNDDALHVLEIIPFDLIEQTSNVRNSSVMDLQLTRRSLILHSHRIHKIKQMIDEYLKEHRSKQGHPTPQPVDVSVRKIESIPPVLASNSSDVLKSSSQLSLISENPTFSELIPSTSVDLPTPPTLNNDSMMEYALRHFKVPSQRRSKKSCKTSEWTWQGYSELIKWSKTPLQSSLLRHGSNRLARLSFLAIMRFMGDYPMARSQTEMDCLFTLLKTMHKHRNVIDEIFCQLVKQLTDNRSYHNDSIQRGWKLLSILLNYFLPSEHLRIHLFRYLHDQRNQQQRLVPLSIVHYEQTLKYGGRKIIPNKAEIDLLTAHGKNGGKRQTFLLPGGIPLTLLITPSMVIADCLHLLCDRLNQTEKEEYSILLISASKYSSRLLHSREYLFDILSECLRSTRIDFHLIIKRVLWLTRPLSSDASRKSDLFIDFMFYQLQAEFLQGTILVLTDERMPEISYLAALQYRATNLADLPSMREVKHLLPATVLKLRSIRPQEWTAMIQEKLRSSVQSMTIKEAKIKFLELIQSWPLFGITFFTVRSINVPTISSPCLIGIGNASILFLDAKTRETLLTITYDMLISIRAENRTVHIHYGSVNLQCQVDRAHELVAISDRYLKVIHRKSVSALEKIG